MKKNFSLLLVIASALGLSTSVFAQQYPDPNQQQQPNGNVSKLEGQIVKVGEQNQYLYTYPKYNVSLNPLGIIFGSYSVSGSIAVHQNFLVRGDINYTDGLYDDNSNSIGLAIGVPIYFSKVYTGYFLEPGLSLAKYNSDFLGEDYSTTIFGPQVMFGWGKIWDSGFNIAMAFGFGRNWANDDRYSGLEVFPAGYFRVGYAFDTNR